MPSKQQLAKRRKNKKTPVDKRSAGKIYKELPTLKPINREYIGHNQGFHYGLIDPKLSTESRMKIIEMEMKPIDKDARRLSIVCYLRNKLWSRTRGKSASFVKTHNRTVRDVGGGQKTKLMNKTKKKR